MTIHVIIIFSCVFEIQAICTIINSLKSVATTRPKGVKREAYAGSQRKDQGTEWHQYSLKTFQIVLPTSHIIYALNVRPFSSEFVSFKGHIFKTRRSAPQ